MKRMLAVVVLGACVAANVCSAGWAYTAVTRGEGGRGADAAGMSVKAWVSDQSSRIEIGESRNPMMQNGSVMVTTDGGKTVYLLNPAEKSYMQWDMAAMMGMAGAAMKMMNMQISQPKIEKLLEEDGGEVAGFPVTHYRYRTSYSMDMNFMGVKQSNAVTTEEDLWATTKLTDPGLGLWLNQRSATTGNEQLDGLIKAEMGKVKGFPLRRIIATKTRDQQGKEQTTKMTTEVTEIRKDNPSADLFKIPEGYRDATPKSSGQEGQSGGGQGGDPMTSLMRMLQQQKPKAP